MDPLIGSTLGQYTILAEIGRDRMGVAYRALNPDLGREVAIKVLAPELCADRERVARFLREARLAARFSHPNIVGVVDAGEQEGRSYPVME